MSIELDGTISLVTYKNGKEVDRDPLDSEVCLKALLMVISDAIKNEKLLLKSKSRSKPRKP
jgi:hypothetical protein